MDRLRILGIVLQDLIAERCWARKDGPHYMGRVIATPPPHPSHTTPFISSLCSFLYRAFSAGEYVPSANMDCSRFERNLLFNSIRVALEPVG